jgi:glycosyltransferase involved in cell wall biosynthesis
LDICIIAPPWLPVPAPAYGGTEAVVDQLARGLVRAGHHVTLFAHPDSTCPVERVSIVPRDETGPIGHGLAELYHAIGAYEMARHADVVHDHTLAGPLYAQRFRGLPVVTTSHGPFTPATTAVYGAMAPDVGLVAISHSQASLTDLPVAAVIHHGIEVEDFPQGQGDGGYAVFLGRMAPEKGPDRAIAAARAAGIPLYIAAKMREPTEVAFFEQHVRPQLGADIVYLGEVSFAEKVELLGGACALVNPIRWPEPFGMVMLESLACGTPVIVHPEGAAPEIIEDGVSGFLPKTQDQLVDALKQVSSMIDRDACRAAARLFSVERMTHAYEKVYVRWRRRATPPLPPLRPMQRPVWSKAATASTTETMKR